MPVLPIQASNLLQTWRPPEQPPLTSTLPPPYANAFLYTLFVSTLAPPLDVTHHPTIT
jgi:hypothetical protein